MKRAAALAFAHAATGLLTGRFTVACWDQRGTGLSYGAADPAEILSSGQLVVDTLAVTKYLAYVGVGQVVSQSNLNEGRLEWLLADVHSRLAPDAREAIGRMRPAQPVSIRYIQKYGGSIHNITPSRLKAIMESSPYRAGSYTDELYDRGAELSHRMLEEEMRDIDLNEQALHVSVPVYLFLGRYDQVTPTAPVLDYFERLQAPTKRSSGLKIPAPDGRRRAGEVPAHLDGEAVRLALPVIGGGEGP